MIQQEGGLVAKQARRADVQNVIGINQNFLTLKRQAADEKHGFLPSSAFAARVPATRIRHALVFYMAKANSVPD